MNICKYIQLGGFSGGSAVKNLPANAGKMGSISVEFNDIDTSSVEENNGYVTYTAIVRTGKSSITGFSVNFILGTETEKVRGYALVSGVNVTKLADEEAYNERHAVTG